MLDQRSSSWMGSICLLPAAIMVAACSSSSSDNNNGGGGSAGRGGGSATGGTTAGTGGTTAGTGGSPVDASSNVPTFNCTPQIVTMPLVSNFQRPVDDAGMPLDDAGSAYYPSWGTYTGMDFSGYSFSFGGTFTTEANGSFHLSGTVSDYSAFVMAFNCWSNASAYTGVSFTIAGNPGPSGAVRFEVDTLGNEAIDPAAAAGTPALCTPASCVSDATVCNKYDGTCAQPAVTIPVTATATPVNYSWAMLTGGKPEMNPNPGQLLRFVWAFNWMGATSTAYPIDITLGPVSFTQ